MNIPRPTTCLALALLAAPLAAGTQYRVTVRGEVEFNGIGSGPLSQVQVGESATLVATVDEDVFVDSGSFPTRGYALNSFALEFDSGPVGLQNPFPGTPFFVLRDNDPAVDGFFIASNVNFPTGVPLNVAGGFGQFANNFSVTYQNDPLPSLDIADAVGTYDFTGLSVFNWTIDDGPFNPFGILFEDLTIEEIVPGSLLLYGCGVNPAGSIADAGSQPSIGKGIRLALDNPLGTQASGSLTALMFGFAPQPGFPCGVSLPGFGMSGAGANGELLVQLVPASPIVPGPAWVGPGTPSVVEVPLPDDPALVAFTVYAQGLLYDPAGSQGVFFGLTDAYAVTIGN